MTRTYFGVTVAEIMNMRTNWAKDAFTLSVVSCSSTTVADKT